MRSSLYSLPRHLSLRPHLHRGRNDQLHRERTSQFRKNANGDYMIVLFNDEIIKICFPRSLTLFVKCDSSSKLHTRLIRYRRLRSIYWTPAEDFLMMNSTSGLWWSSQGEENILNIWWESFLVKIIKAICLLSVNLNKCSIFFLQSEDRRQVKILVITSTLLSFPLFSLKHSKVRENISKNSSSSRRKTNIASLLQICAMQCYSKPVQKIKLFFVTRNKKSLCIYLLKCKKNWYAFEKTSQSSLYLCCL